jgi:hypothetical protein
LLRDTLIAAQDTGRSLREGTPRESAASDWVYRTRALIEAGLDEAEAIRFVWIGPYTTGDSGERARIMLDTHLDRLSKLIRRVDSLEPLEVRPDFDPDEFQERESSD